jgi:hypothetical protein
MGVAAVREVAVAGGLVAVGRGLLSPGRGLVAVRTRLISVREDLVAISRRLIVDQCPRNRSDFLLLCSDRLSRGIHVTIS